MSIDVSVSCPCCGSTICDENITYNVAGIYYEALNSVGIEGGLRGLDGKTLEDVIEQIRKATTYLQENDTALRKLEPENGWGGIRCVYRVFGALVKAHDGVDTDWDWSPACPKGVLYVR